MYKRERSLSSTWQLIILKQLTTSLPPASLFILLPLPFFSFLFFFLLRLSFTPLFMWTGLSDQTVKQASEGTPDSAN